MFIYPIYNHNWRNISDIYIYRVSQEECARLRESVPYVKLYRYNPKHLYPKLNGYWDNGQRSLIFWQLLHTYWLPNTHWNWREYVVSVMLISVLNIKLTCEWHKAIKLNYKNTRTTVVFVLRFPSTLRSSQLFRYLAKVTALRRWLVVSRCRACAVYEYGVTDGVQYVDTAGAHTFRWPLSP